MVTCRPSVVCRLCCARGGRNNWRVTRDLDLDDVLEYFTLDGGELALLRNKFGATRLGFVAMLKFLLWKGRFPRGGFELPGAALEHLGRQVQVAASDVSFYDFAGRASRGHRREIRHHTGFGICSVSDAEKLAGWLGGNIAQEERRAEQVRAQLLAHCKTEKIEPPSPARTATIVDSGIRQADELLVVIVVARLHARYIDVIEALVPADDKTDNGGPAEADRTTGGSGDPEPDDDVLNSIKSSPGNVSLATMLCEIGKLDAVRAVGLPADLFTGISPKVVTAWRARAAVESPSHLRRHDQPIRLVLLAALLYQREREVTDTLVELLNSTIHKINARAEKKVTEAFVARYRQVRNTDALLRRVAEVSLERPQDRVAEVIYPVLGGEAGITDLLAEYKARPGGYAADKRRVFASSYTGHYRAGLIKLLQALEFRSNNDDHQPVLDGWKLILRFAAAKITYYPVGVNVVLDGIVKHDWREFALGTDAQGRQRIVRTVDECCVLEALRDRLRCKEIWVVGADK